MTTAPLLLWFRRDLRLADNQALAVALQSGAPVIPVFILDETTPGKWAPGGASRWWLHGALASLDADLRKRGSALRASIPYAPLPCRVRRDLEKRREWKGDGGIR